MDNLVYGSSLNHKNVLTYAPTEGSLKDLILTATDLRGLPSSCPGFLNTKIIYALNKLNCKKK